MAGSTVIVFGFLLLNLNIYFSVSQGCTLPEELWGNWTSSNLGTIVITGSSPSLTFTKLFTAQNVSVNEMECRFTSGTQYVLESTIPVYTFSLTDPIFIWLCLDLRRTSAYSYYYYLNSPPESGFDGYRLVGLPDSSVTLNDVCTESLDVAEFNTMIKDGFETDAVNTVMCADPLLGSFNYTYTDSSATSCDNTGASINACDNSNRTHIIVNNTGCASVNPFYSTDGLLGCIVNVYDSSSDVYYISLYNLDTSPSTQFICIAITKASNDTVYLSMKQTDCEADQSPTTLPADGATMILTPYYTCLLDTETKNRNWTWLYVFLPCLILLVIFILTCLYLFWWLKKRETRKARNKQPLVGGNHPLGEVSLKLDAPESLGLQNGYIDRKSNFHAKPSRAKKGRGGDDILGEQSLNLNLETQTWTQHETDGRVKKHRVDENNFSGAAVTSSNGSIQNGSVRTSKTTKSIGGRWKTKTKNFLTTRMVTNSFKERQKNKQSKSYDKSTIASSRRGLSASFRKTSTGVHPEPMKRSNSIALSKLKSDNESRSVSRAGSMAGSRPGSRASSRRGSIDNLVLSRNTRLPRSKTLVLAQLSQDKSPDIYTMPEEFVTEGGLNEVRPSRPKQSTGTSLRDTYQSLNRRSNTKLALKKPGASRQPWH